MKRRPPLARRMADLLARYQFAATTLLASVPRRPGQDPASPGTYDPSVARLNDEAAALIAEYRRKARRDGD